MMGKSNEQAMQQGGCHQDFQLRGATHFKHLQGDNGAMDEMDAMNSSSFEGEVHTPNRPSCRRTCTTKGGAKTICEPAKSKLGRE